jgi:hypothetical protein
MPVSQSIWRITQPPQRLRESALTSEKSLEAMIIATPEIVSDQWMIIGQQEDTGFGGRIDLLAIAPDSSLILIEIKRGRSPREVVAQAGSGALPSRLESSFRRPMSRTSLPWNRACNLTLPQRRCG